MKKFILAATCALSFSALADISVVVHPSNTTSATQSELSKIFLGKKKTFPNGQQAVPVNQEDTAVSKEFNTKVLGKQDSQLKAYWSKLVFTGKGTPPKKVANDDEVLALVKSNPNIIGYIDSSKVTGDVKVLATF